MECAYLVCISMLAFSWILIDPAASRRPDNKRQPRGVYIFRAEISNGKCTSLCAGTPHANGLYKGFNSSSNMTDWDSYCFWRQETNTKPRVFHFNTATGKLTVARRGVYEIYGQMAWVDNGPISGMKLQVTRQQTDEVVTRALCIAPATSEGVGVPGVSPGGVGVKGDSFVGRGIAMCSTSAIVTLQAGDEVYIAPAYRSRHTIINQNSMVFWRVRKL